MIDPYSHVMSCPAGSAPPDTAAQMRPGTSYSYAADKDLPTLFATAGRITGGACCASGENPSGELVRNLFDGDIATKWLDFGGGGAHGTAWVEYRLLHEQPAVCLTNYDLVSANDCPERDPAHWLLECIPHETGSNHQTSGMNGVHTSEAAYSSSTVGDANGPCSQKSSPTGQTKLQDGTSMDLSRDPNTQDVVVSGQPHHSNDPSIAPTDQNSSNQSMHAVHQQLPGSQPYETLRHTSCSTDHHQDPPSPPVHASGTWVVLDERHGEVFSRRHQLRSFTIKHPVVSSQYRLKILHTANPQAANSMQLSCCNLYAAGQAESVSSDVAADESVPAGDAAENDGTQVAGPGGLYMTLGDMSALQAIAHNSEEACVSAVSLLNRILTNIQQHPGEHKYSQIRADKLGVLLQRPCMVKALLHAGFRPLFVYGRGGSSSSDKHMALICDADNVDNMIQVMQLLK